MLDRKTVEFAKFDWYMSDVRLYMEKLTNEQMGELFFAVMKYAETGERMTVSQAIEWPFSAQCNKVDSAKAAYLKRSETNARNGKAGGEAKARNAKKAMEAEKTTTPKFTPPTKTEFKDMVKHILENEGYVDFDNHEALMFYNNLVESGWTIKGVPIQKLSTVYDLFIYRFSDNPEVNRAYDYKIFEELFCRLNGDFSVFCPDDLLDKYRAETDDFAFETDAGNVKIVRRNEGIKAVIDAFLAEPRTTSSAYRI